MFRKVALDRLSSPEGLETMMQVVNPKGWLALLALLATVAASVAWGYLDRIHTTAQGSGIFVARDGVFLIEASGSGTLRKLLVSKEENVKVGQVVALISQPDLEQRIRHSDALLADLRRNRGASTTMSSKDVELQLQAIAQKQAQARTNIEALTKRVEWLKERVTANEEAVRQGIATGDSLQNAIQQLAQTEAEITTARVSLEELAAQGVSLQNQQQRSTFQLDREIQEAERAGELLKAQLDREGQVRSPYAGRVVEVVTDEGQLVAPGRAILSIELKDQPLVVLGFIRGEGQKLRPGMKALVLPANVRAEDYGFMLGQVYTVSEYPITPQGALVILKNAELAQSLVGTGNPYLVRIAPLESETTASGYEWTGRKGPPFPIGTGTVCSVQVITETRRPISLVIPTVGGGGER
ncbi:MAG: NHLP bacteriocin system secretion protein [Planctomycetes bacterium]|nr:NHLP bacteriocin system secretion protein [Planctomycetota bacterium]